MKRKHLRKHQIFHLPNLDQGKKKHKNASDTEVDELLKEFLVEKAPTLKRLSNK